MGCGVKNGDIIKAVGFKHRGVYQEYSIPIEFKYMKYVDGEFLCDTLLGKPVAVKIKDAFYLTSIMFSPIKFDHILVLEGNK